MKIIPVTTTIGVINEPVWTVKDFPWHDIEEKIEWTRYKRYRHICTSFFATFDIETTTTYKRDVENKPYDAIAWMYQWQFCIDNKVIFGRTWQDFQKLVVRLQDIGFDAEHILICYVHNLSYEFQFMQNFLHWEEIFARQKKKPLKARCSEGIEFRCSYIMSNMSLEKFCENEKNVRHCKNAGIYDYSTIRTPATPLTEIEESYCYNDVRGLYECVESRLLEDTLLSIPLTSTGYVRREVKNAMTSDRKAMWKVKSITLTEEIYTLLREAFRGGDTHANAYWVNEILENIDSYDMTSSYPYVIMTRKFPMTKFNEVSPKSFARWKTKEYAILAHIKLENVKYSGKCGAPYISLSKTQNPKKPVIDNGRVLSADSLEMTITDVDWEIIHSTYNYSDMYCSRLYVSHYDYLPLPLRRAVLSYFTQKCELKGVSGKEYEYMKSKNRLNGIYGMMVTDILQDDIIYHDMEWNFEEQDIAKTISKYNGKGDRCLAYQWGVWVTAWARLNLHRGREPIGHDVIYGDTDSVKSFANHALFYEQLNDYIINEEIRKAPLPPSVRVNGKTYNMGIWEHDAHYEKFKTLGAKKYAYVEDGKIGVTVAGLSKKLGKAALEKKGGIDAFKIGSKFEPSGNMTAFYNFSQPYELEVGNCKFLTASNVALIPTSYILGITGEYEEIIENMKKGIDISHDF